MVCVLEASRVTSCALNVAPSATEACVRSVTRFSATAAPTPDPVDPAVAFALEAVAEVALKVAFAAGALRVPLRDASVCTFAIVRPSEPATPTDAAAPEIPSLDAPAPPLAASTETVGADAVPAIDASLATVSSVIATPTPIAAEPPVALPSAFAAADTVSDDFKVSTPPDVTVTASGTVAFADAFRMVTATAAATETGPPDVDGAGVALEPDPETPLLDAVVPAFVRSPFT